MRHAGLDASCSPSAMYAAPSERDEWTLCFQILHTYNFSFPHIHRIILQLYVSMRARVSNLPFEKRQELRNKAPHNTSLLNLSIPYLFSTRCRLGHILTQNIFLFLAFLAVSLFCSFLTSGLPFEIPVVLLSCAPVLLATASPGYS